MSTVIDFVQDLHERQMDVTKKGVDTLLGVATKLVDAQASAVAKLQEQAPKLPEALTKLTEPVESFVGAPADYVKWVEATAADWDKMRRRVNVRFVELTNELDQGPGRQERVTDPSRQQPGKARTAARSGPSLLPGRMGAWSTWTAERSGTSSASSASCPGCPFGSSPGCPRSPTPT